MPAAVDLYPGDALQQPYSEDAAHRLLDRVAYVHTQHAMIDYSDAADLHCSQHRPGQQMVGVVVHPDTSDDLQFVNSAEELFAVAEPAGAGQLPHRLAVASSQPSWIAEWKTAFSEDPEDILSCAVYSCNKANRNHSSTISLMLST